MQKHEPIYFADCKWFSYLVTTVYLVAFYLAYRINFVFYAIWIFLIVDWWHFVRMHAAKTHPRAIQALIRDTNKWQYKINMGCEYKAKIQYSACYVSNILIVIRLKSLTFARFLVIPRGSISDHNYRYLAYYITNRFVK